MLKYAILATAMIVSAPASAQQAQTPPATGSAQPSTVPETPSTSAPTDTTATATPPADSAAPAATAQTASQPAAGGDQVAQVVESEFATYDKDSNGALSKTEFASWMDTLKASDPAAPTKAAEKKKWNSAAFAQADTDKSRSVSKGELTAFLSAGPKAG